MGTSYSIKLVPAPSAANRERLKAMVEQRLAAINQQMSTYIDDSDLMRFNRSTSTDWQPVPAALASLAAQANRISALSEGRYDITVGPLVDLWGFGSKGVPEQAPGDDEVADTLRQVGYKRLRERAEPPALQKTVAGLEVDLSSIAKGWAVDQLAVLLEDLGVKSYLVEIGGEVRAHGRKPNGETWRIAVEKPVRDGRVVQRVINLHNSAMATSGDYRNFYQEGGRYYSHTIDPISGYPVQHRLASVTVLADTCADADAWATALLALGEDHGPKLAAELGIKSLFIVRTADGFLEETSPAFAEAER
jgi:thiamine biosynthesis lipoprotein